MPQKRGRGTSGQWSPQDKRQGSRESTKVKKFSKEIGLTKGLQIHGTQRIRTGKEMIARKGRRPGPGFSKKMIAQKGQRPGPGPCGPGFLKETDQRDGPGFSKKMIAQKGARPGPGF